MVELVFSLNKQIQDISEQNWKDQDLKIMRVAFLETSVTNDVFERWIKTLEE